jgi:hypothetical protein
LLCPKSPWGGIWQAKFAQGIGEKVILCQNNLQDESLIWNHTKYQLEMIHQNNFWVNHKDGKTTNFWVIKDEKLQIYGKTLGKKNLSSENHAINF